VQTFSDLSGQQTITLPSVGVYVLEVNAKKTNGFNRIEFSNGVDKAKMKDIKQWGNIVWSNFSSSFFGCGNMVVTATDAPNLSIVSDITFMFFGTLFGEKDLSNWNTSNISVMDFVFKNATNANPDTSNWDVSNAIRMREFFNNSNLSVENLTACYENWSQLNLQQNVSFGAGTTKYNSSGQAGRDILVNTYNWNITDGNVV
jgi:hypothetical protein